jgi:quercetin dioxygenase-like cupin family protein
MGVVHRFTGTDTAYDWEDVLNKDYKDGDVKGASKKVLMAEAEGCNNFRVRYFRIDVGGHSRLEQHDHEHAVIMLHGRARVRHGDQEDVLGPRDVVFIPGGDIHQLTTVGDEPMGFVCIVPAHA